MKDRPLYVYVLAFAGLSFIGGFLAGGADGKWPRETDSYKIVAKQQCLTDEGISFTLHYNGIGDATFLVVPPSAPEGEKESSSE